MRFSLKQTILSFVASLLVIILLVPSLVKFAHVFDHHTHTVCTNWQKLHFHEYDLECEFYDFKISPQITFEKTEFEIVITDNDFSFNTSQYQSISDYQRLSFLLRGPPGLV